VAVGVAVAVAELVAVGVSVAAAVAVGVAVLVRVGELVTVGATVAVLVGAAVNVAVAVLVGVLDGVEVGDGVFVAVRVGVEVADGVTVKVGEGVAVGVAHTAPELALVSSRTRYTVAPGAPVLTENNRRVFAPVTASVSNMIELFAGTLPTPVRGGVVTSSHSKSTA
jgi:hypothetical protein